MILQWTVVTHYVRCDQCGAVCPERIEDQQPNEMMAQKLAERQGWVVWPGGTLGPPSFEFKPAEALCPKCKEPKQ